MGKWCEMATVDVKYDTTHERTPPSGPEGVSPPGGGKHHPTGATVRVREIARGASKSARLEAPPGPDLDGSEQSGSGTQPHDQI